MPRINSIHWKEFEKFILHIGCTFEREKRDHRMYWKKGLKRPIVLPRYSSLPTFIIVNNLHILGISREEYLKILKKL